MALPLRPELLEQARELLTQGLSLRQAALRVGCSHVSLSKRIGPRAVPPRYPDEAVRQVRELFAAGQSPAVIARDLQLPYGSVLDWIWNRTRRDAGGPICTPSRVPRGGSCERLCRHWGAHGCGLQLPPEDWSPRYCSSFSRRADP